VTVPVPLDVIPAVAGPRELARDRLDHLCELDVDQVVVELYERGPEDFTAARNLAAKGAGEPRTAPNVYVREDQLVDGVN
jgi:hypothetical protein